MNLEWVSLGWCRSGSMMQDQSDHGASKDPMNPLWSQIHRFVWCTNLNQWWKIIPIMVHQRNQWIPCAEWIHQFFWCTMIWVILHHWSWSRSSQRNMPLVQYIHHHKDPKVSTLITFRFSNLSSLTTFGRLLFSLPLLWDSLIVLNMYTDMHIHST